MNRATFASLAARSRPIVTPLAHDALSARLIEMAGFEAFAIGGSAMLAARHAMPDIGLAALADMAGGIRDIAAATRLPFLADGDDGYGDVKSVARTVAAYETLGAGAILIEDQVRDNKQQRAERATALADDATMAAKLTAALDARESRDTWIIGRTDAYGMAGLDEALRRAEMFLTLGVDGIFIAGVRTEDDYARIGRTLSGTFLSAAMFEGGDTPWLTPATLGEMGFGHVSFPGSLILRAVAAMESALAGIRAHADGSAAMERYADFGPARQTLDEAVRLAHWRAIESGAARGSGS
jgi:2-methylisocitrate lyase-like PEP mutase family enzyme